MAEGWRTIKALCVFCGSSDGTQAEYQEVAQSLGAEMARRGITLVYGGGNLGLMGGVSAAVLQGGGSVVGVIPRALDREVKLLGEGGGRPPSERERVIVVETMHERKQVMYDMADAFLALPGGLGTFEELFEAVTHQQLGIHTKHVGILNVCGFYDQLIGFLKHSESEGFVRGGLHRLKVFSNVDQVIQGLSSLERVPSVLKWHLDKEDL